MLDTDALYRAVGRNIRDRREMSPQKLSQQKLADELGISRASIVNIEAGRQHAPLHLLWQIADVLGTDVTQFVPKREELVAAENKSSLDLDQLGLDKEAIKQIKNLVPNPAEQRLLAGFISSKSSTLKSNIQKSQSSPSSGTREIK